MSVTNSEDFDLSNLIESRTNKNSFFTTEAKTQ